MPSPGLWTAFVVAAIALVLVPGPNTFFLLARGLQQGRRAAVGAALGVELSTIVLASATAVGLSGLLAASEVAFQLVKWAGVAYLCYLGVKAFASSGEDHDVLPGTTRPAVRFGRQLLDGFTVGVSNPKVVLFFIAFLPQFVDPARPAGTQLFLLGLTLAGIGLVYGVLLGQMAGGVRDWLGRRPGRPARLERASGLAYLALAGWAATTGRRSA